MEELRGRHMFFGADWDAILVAEYEPDDPDCGIIGGFNLEHIELHGYYDGDRLIKFNKPAIVWPDKFTETELRRLEEGFEDEYINNVDPF